MSFRTSPFSVFALTLSLIAASSLGLAQGNSWKSDGTGTKTWTNGNSWKNSEDPESTGVPEDNHTAIVEAGILEIASLQGIGYLKMIGGNLRGLTGLNLDTLELRGNSAHSEWFNGSIRQLNLLISSGAILDVANSSNNDFVGSQIENSGTFNWTSGNLTTDSVGGITNNAGALFADQNTSNVSIGATGAIFENYGTYSKSGPGTTTVSQMFNNYSANTLEVSDGIFEITGGGTNIDGAVMRVTHSGLISFKTSPYTIVNAADLQIGTVQNENALTGSHSFTLPEENSVNFGYKLESSTLTLGNVEGSALNVAFLQSGGTLAGTHFIAADYYLAAGNLNSTGTTTITNGGSLTLANSGQNDFRYRTIENQAGGTVNWTHGDLRSGSGGLFNNHGTFNDSAAGVESLETVNNVYGGTALIFTNQSTGTYNKTGAGETRFDVNFNNDGAVTVNDGTLNLDGGGTSSSTGTFTVASGATLKFDADYSVADAATVTGSGSLKLSAGTLTIDGEVGVSDFRIEGGTLAGTQTFTNGATWTGGNLNSLGTTTNASGSTFNLSHSGQNDFRYRTIENQAGGTVNWTDGDLRSGSGGLFNNHGTFNDSAAGVESLETVNNVYGGTALIFTNQSTGTYNKTGAGETRFDVNFNNDGTVNINDGTLNLDGGGTSTSTGTFTVASGASLKFDADYSVADAATLTGSGSVKLSAGTLTIDGEIGVSDFRIEGGTLAGTQTFTNGATWTGGNLNSLGTTTNASGSTFNLSHSGQNDFRYRTIENQAGGTVNWTDGDLRSGSGGLFNNHGTFNDSAAGVESLEIVNNVYGGTALIFTNQSTGTYNKTGAGETRFDVNFNNDGTVNVNDGTLNLNGEGASSASGTFAVASGATLQFDSNYAVADAANLSGDGKFLLSASDLQLDGNLSVDFEQDGGDLDGSFDISGVFDWLDGTWSAAVEDALTTINFDGVLNLKDSTHFYHNRDIVNHGTVNWTGGTMLGNAHSSFTNYGLFLDQSDSDHNISESSGSSSFDNQGTYLKTGAGTTRIDQTFTNSSPRTLDVSNGILELNGGGTNFSGGAMVTNNTGLIRFTDNFTIQNAANLSVGTISGPAGYELSGGDLDLAGVLSVDFLQTGGDLDGTHHIAGTYNWNGGDLNSDADGNTTTIDFSGTLNVNPTALPAQFNNRDILNQGIVNWNNANLSSNSAGSFTNDGTLNDNLTTSQTFSGAPVFTNNAGYFKNHAGTTEFDSDFDNNGFVVVSDGTLKLDGGGTSINGASFTVETGGTLQIDNDYVIDGAAGLLGAGKFLLSNGDLTLNGDLSVDFEQTGGNLDGTQTIAGTFDLGGFGDWDATTPGSSTVITETGTLNLTGNSRTFNNRTIINYGTVDWMDGNLESNAEGSFINWGNFNDNQLEDHRFYGAAEFVNSGVYTKIDGNVTEFDSAFNNDGTVNVNNGTLKLDGGGLTSSTGTISVATDAKLIFDADYALSSGAKIEGDGRTELAHGTLTLDTAVDAKDFQISGGTLTGNSTFNQGANWTGGSLADGRTTNATGSTFTLDQTSGNILSNHTFENDGVVEWQTSNLVLNNASAFENRGTFNDTASTTATVERITKTSGTPGVFTNAVTGVYHKTTAGQTKVEINFDNHGQVNVNTGTFMLDGNGTSSSTGGFHVAEGATLWFDNSYTIANANNLTGPGQYRLASGLLTVGGTVSVNFLQTAGELTGTNNLSGAWDWQGGFWGGGSTTIDSVGLLKIAGSSLTLDNHIINNHGTVDWKSGFLSMNNGATITNSQTWTDNSTISGSDNYILTNSPAFSSFTNSGTYDKNGDGNSVLRIPFHNTGTINVNGGQLDLEAGGTMGSLGKINAAAGSAIRFFNTFDVPDASALSGDGSFTIINGTMDLQGTFAGSTFYSNNSTLTGDHNFSTFASLERTAWNDGATTVNPGATLQIGGHNSVSGTTMSNRSLINQGTLSWHSEDLVLNDASSISNEGLLLDENNGASGNSHLYTASGDAGSFTNQATGTYEKRSTDTTIFDLPLSNFGAIDVQAGNVTVKAGGFSDSSSSIQIAEGATFELRSDFNISPDASISGNGAMVNSIGTLTGGGLIGSNFAQTSGVIDGNFNFGGQFALTGGSIAPNHQINLTGNALSSLHTTSLDLDGSLITVGPSSTLQWTRGSIRTGNDGGMKVDGVMTTDFNGSILSNLGGQGVLDIAGEFRKTSGDGVTTFAVPINLSGRLDVLSGTVRITESGTSDGGLFDVGSEASIDFQSGFTFNDGTNTQNGGALNLNAGVFNLNGNVGLGGDASITGGTITGTHNLSGRILIDGASFDDSGTTTIAANSSLALADPTENLLPRNVVNNGKLLWSDGELTGSGDNSLTNNGEFAIATDGTFSSSADDYTLTNNGDMKKIGGEGITTIDVAFTNNGLVTAESGQFHFTDTLTIGSGGTLGGGVKFDAPLTLPQGSTLAGNGTISGSITTGGKVAPGNSIGSLNIEGDLNMLPTAVSFFEIDLTATPSPVDFLSVSGTLNLNGILTYDLLSNILPNTVDTYTILSAGTLTGSFANIASGSRIFNPTLEASFVVNYGSSSAFDPNSVVFSGFDFTPVPEPSTFSLLVIGIGFIMWGSRRRRA